MTTTTYTEAVRVQESVLAPLEKRCLIWMAGRMPSRVNSDHLTILAGVAMAGVGLCYWQGSPAALLGAVLLLAVNWFGDSLDGTLARVRHHERPRYGFYVDHVLDAAGTIRRANRAFCALADIPVVMSTKDIEGSVRVSREYRGRIIGGGISMGQGAAVDQFQLAAQRHAMGNAGQ